MGFFRSLLDPRIAIVETSLTAEFIEPACNEAFDVVCAVPRRRLEFAAGRHCARRAMETLGHTTVSLPRRPDRTPGWPDGIVGSITHTNTWAAAAVGRRDQGVTAIGIDLEPANELTADLWSSVSTPQERSQLADLKGFAPGYAAHLIFCMKEAAYKCQYTLSNAVLEFEDLAVEVNADGRTFFAVFRRAADPFRVTDRLLGCFAVFDGHFATSVVVMTPERSP